MTDFPPPTVAWRAADDPSGPLVVLLHGRGADEAGIVGLADHLPAGASYAAVRAPLGEGGGYAWFANRGIGRPVAESLEETMAWFRGWLDDVAPAGRPVVLVGFSGGAAFAGGLLLAEPGRFTGAAILYGTLPFDAGVPVTPGRLAAVPVFVAQGEADTVIPRELLDRTWDYLRGESGASTHARRDPGGHSLTADTVAELADWIAGRVQPADAAMNPEQAAAELRRARRQRHTVPPFTDAHPHLDEAWGYAVQAHARRDRLAAGERLVGLKLGLTSAAKQARMGVDRPIVGFLTDAMLVTPGEVAERLHHWVQPRIEPELVFVTARDLDRPLTPDQVGASLAGVAVAAEVIDSRFTDYRFRLPDVVADNTSAAGVLVGAPVALHEVGDPGSLRCEVRVDGELVHHDTASAILGDPLRAVQLLTEHLHAQGETLPAGSLVLAGAITDAVPLAAGHRYTLGVERLGVIEVAPES